MPHADSISILNALIASKVLKGNQNRGRRGFHAALSPFCAPKVVELIDGRLSASALSYWIVTAVLAE